MVSYLFLNLAGHVFGGLQILNQGCVSQKVPRRGRQTGQQRIFQLFQDNLKFILRLGEVRLQEGQRPGREISRWHGLVPQLGGSGGLRAKALGLGTGGTRQAWKKGAGVEAPKQCGVGGPASGSCSCLSWAAVQQERGDHGT